LNNIHVQKATPEFEGDAGIKNINPNPQMNTDKHRFCASLPKGIAKNRRDKDMPSVLI